MNKYYVTYGNNTKQANNFSVVDGTSMSDARETLFERIGANWAFVYSEVQWKENKPQERFGLSEIPLQPHVKK